jgi:hypothetical protein
MYNAQMIRTWSLLLRAARRQGYVLPARPETAPLSEHTFILHPVEAGAWCSTPWVDSLPCGIRLVCAAEGLGFLWPGG